MDKFEKSEMTKKSCLQRNTSYKWYSWLINYVPEPIRKAVSGVKGKVMSLFKTNATKYYSKPTHVKNGHGGEK